MRACVVRACVVCDVCMCCMVVSLAGLQGQLEQQFSHQLLEQTSELQEQLRCQALQEQMLSGELVALRAHCEEERQREVEGLQEEIEGLQREVEGLRFYFEAELDARETELKSQLTETRFMYECETAALRQQLTDQGPIDLQVGDQSGGPMSHEIVDQSGRPMDHCVGDQSGGPSDLHAVIGVAVETDQVTSGTVSKKVQQMTTTGETDWPVLGDVTRETDHSSINGTQRGSGDSIDVVNGTEKNIDDIVDMDDSLNGDIVDIDDNVRRMQKPIDVINVDDSVDRMLKGTGADADTDNSVNGIQRRTGDIVNTGDSVNRTDVQNDDTAGIDDSVNRTEMGTGDTVNVDNSISRTERGTGDTFDVDDMSEMDISSEFGSQSLSHMTRHSSDVDSDTFDHSDSVMRELHAEIRGYQEQMEHFREISQCQHLAAVNQLRMELSEKKHKTEQELELVKSRAADTEQELEQVKSQAADTEQELELVKSQAADTEQELELVKSQAADTEQELELVKSQAADTEQELELVKSQASDTEQELELVKSQASDTEQELELVKSRAADTEQELELVKSKASDTEQELELVKSPAADTEQELELVKSQAADTEQELELVKSKAADTEQELELVKSQAADTELELELVKSKAADTEQELELVKSRAAEDEDHLRRELRESFAAQLVEIKSELLIQQNEEMENWKNTTHSRGYDTLSGDKGQRPHSDAELIHTESGSNIESVMLRELQGDFDSRIRLIEEQHLVTLDEQQKELDGLRAASGETDRHQGDTQEKTTLHLTTEPDDNQLVSGDKLDRGKLKEVTVLRDDTKLVSVDRKDGDLIEEMTALTEECWKLKANLVECSAQIKECSHKVDRPGDKVTQEWDLFDDAVSALVTEFDDTQEYVSAEVSSKGDDSESTGTASVVDTSLFCDSGADVGDIVPHVGACSDMSQLCDSGSGSGVDTKQTKLSTCRLRSVRDVTRVVLDCTREVDTMRQSVTEQQGG